MDLRSALENTSRNVNSVIDALENSSSSNNEELVKKLNNRKYKKGNLEKISINSLLMKIKLESKYKRKNNSFITKDGYKIKDITQIYKNKQ